MIKIEQLRKEFAQGAVALDNIDLEIEESSFVALLGPSGCGKSTTLNCMAGLLEPTAGKISFGDQDVTYLPPKDRNIGMVFQSYALYPHMKVIDNIAFSLKQQGVRKDERHLRAREIAKKLQIEPLLNRTPAELSGGQQQRVSMARALIKNPRILLLDEPMSNLDARLKIEIREEIRRIQKETKITAILVTHDQEEAMSMCDRIAILDKGRIQQYDTPQELYHNPKNLFVAHFMGNPPMNFIDATLVYENDRAYLTHDLFKVAVSERLQKYFVNTPARAVTIGARSHEIGVHLESVDNSVPLHVQMIENLGKEVMVTGKVGDSYVRVSLMDVNDRLVGKMADYEGREVHIVFEEHHIFDSETGENLTYRTT